MKNITLGQRIKEARLERKMTQSEVAGDFITRNMLSQIENDVANPSIKTIEYLAKQLNKSVQYFFDAMIDVDDTNHFNYNEVILEIRKSYIERNWEICINKLESALSDHSSIFDNILEVYIILRNSYANLGIKYFEIGKFDEAVELLYQFFKYESQTIYKDLYLKNKVLVCLSEIYLIKKDYEKVKRYLDTLGENDIKINIDNVYILLVCELLLEKLKKKEFRENIKYVNVKELDYYYSAKYYYLMGRYYFLNNNHTKAIENLLLSEDISHSEKHFHYLTKIYELLGDSYSQLEDYKNAYIYIKKANSSFRSD